MKNFTKCFALIALSLCLYSEQGLAFSDTETEAKEAFHDFISEIKTNKEFRSLIRSSRKKENNESREILQHEVHAFFNSRGIELGYFESGFYKSLVFLFMGFSESYDDYDMGSYGYSFGPGMGFSVGYRLTGCTLKRSPTLDKGNWGVKATAVVVAGVTASLVFGENGMCVNIGAALGLEAHLALEHRVFNND